MVLELVLADLEQDFNHVLCSLVDIGFVQDISELVKDGDGNRRLHVLEVLTNFSAESNCDFYTVIGRLVQQQQ